MERNICLINDSFAPTIDGVANAVMNYAAILNRDFGRASVVTPFVPGAEDDKLPFPVLRYPSLGFTGLEGYRAGYPFSAAVLDSLEEDKFDLIHSHCPFTATMLARALRDRIDVPVVFTYHTKYDVDIANAVDLKPVQDGVIRWIVQNIEACDEVWTVSRGAGENLRSLGYEGEWTVMENGVDMPLGKADPDAAAAAAAGYDLPAGVPLFLFVGRLMWYKGIRIFLDALAALQAEGIDFRMGIIGGGADEQEIRETVRSLGLDGRVFFTGTIRDREVIRAWYSRADLFLFPSTFDTNGLVVREAAACGLASVLIRNSCAAEGVTDGENGFLIAENAASMAALLRRLVKEPEAMARVGQGAMTELYLSWEEAVRRARERYGLVLERFRSGYYQRRPTLPDEYLRMQGERMEAMAKAEDRARATLDALQTFTWESIDRLDDWMNPADGGEKRDLWQSLRDGFRENSDRYL